MSDCDRHAGTVSPVSRSAWPDGDMPLFLDKVGRVLKVRSEFKSEGRKTLHNYFMVLFRWTCERHPYR